MDVKAAVGLIKFGLITLADIPEGDFKIAIQNRLAL